MLKDVDHENKMSEEQAQEARTMNIFHESEYGNLKYLSKRLTKKKNNFKLIPE